MSSAIFYQSLELTKPRVVALIVFTAIIGMFLAVPGMVPLRALIFGTIGIWLAARYLEETAPGDGAFDLSGQVSAVAALGTLTAAVITAGTLGWAAPLVLILFAIALVCGIAFVVVESRPAHPRGNRESGHRAGRRREGNYHPAT